MKITNVICWLSVQFIRFCKKRVCLAFLVSSCVYGENLPDVDPFQKQTLIKQITDIANQHDLVGLQVSINHIDGELLNLNHGLISIEKNIGVKRDSLFRAGSISKTIAAIALLQLVEKGKIDLSTPVQQLAPEIAIHNPWEDKYPVSVLHLLEHTAGFDDIHFQEYVVDGSQMTTKEALDFYPDTRNVRYQPGQFMSYTNVGPTIIAYLIEKISEVSYEQYVQHNIFIPLDISAASFHLTSDVSASLASGYIVNEGEKLLVSYQHLKDRASGALNINASDLSKIQRMLLGYVKPSFKSVLTGKSINYMSTIESTLAAKQGYQIGYGKYLNSELTNGSTWIGHSGEMVGYLSEMWHSNNKQTGFVLLTNTGGDTVKQGIQKIKQLLKSFISEISMADKKINYQPSYADKPILDYSEVVGSYRQYTSRLSRLAFFEVLETFSTLYIENNDLKLTTPHATYTLVPIGGNVFRTNLKDGGEIAVIFAKTNGVWYYQIPALFINASKTSPLLKPLSFALLITFFSSSLIIAITLTVQFLRSFIKKRTTKTKSLKWFMLSPLCLGGVIIFLGSAGSSGMPLMLLGQLTVQSVGVSTGLLLFLVSSLIANYYFWFADKPELQQNKKYYHLGFVSYFAIVNIAMLITLLWLDFIFVAFWY